MSDYDVSDYNKRSTDRLDKTIHGRFLRNLKTLCGQSAWMLILPVVAALWFVDAALVKTMMQWTLMSGLIAGVALIIVGLMLPSIRVADLLPEIRKGNMAVAVVAAAFMFFMALVFIVLALWAKP